MEVVFIRLLLGDTQKDFENRKRKYNQISASGMQIIEATYTRYVNAL